MFWETLRVLVPGFTLPGAVQLSDHAAGSSAVDPVWSRTVDTATAQPTFEHGGGTVYFCGPGRRAAFAAADPDAYPRARAGAGGGGRR